MILMLKIVLSMLQIVFKRMRLAKNLIDLAAYLKLWLTGLPRISAKVISLISKTI